MRDQQNDPALAAEIALRSPQLCHPDRSRSCGNGRPRPFRSEAPPAVICAVEGPCVF